MPQEVRKIDYVEFHAADFDAVEAFYAAAVRGQCCGRFRGNAEVT
jgi:hypothetical protein